MFSQHGTLDAVLNIGQKKLVREHSASGQVFCRLIGV